MRLLGDVYMLAVSNMLTLLGSQTSAFSFDKLFPSAEMCSSSLSNRASTTSSKRANFKVNRGNFIRTTAICVNFSKQIFTMRIKKRLWKHRMSVAFYL